MGQVSRTPAEVHWSSLPRQGRLCKIRGQIFTYFGPQTVQRLGSTSEAVRPGVYILYRYRSGSGEPTAYVGEAEEVGKRLKQHPAKDFWNQVVAFMSKDENLTKGHIKYLEGKLIDCGFAAGRGVIVNAQSSGAKLPETDQAEKDIFLDRMLKLLPIIGTNLFTPSEEKVESKNENPIAYL